MSLSIFLPVFSDISSCVSFLYESLSLSLTPLPVCVCVCVRARSVCVRARARVFVCVCVCVCARVRPGSVVVICLVTLLKLLAKVSCSSRIGKRERRRSTHWFPTGELSKTHTGHNPVPSSQEYAFTVRLFICSATGLFVL